MSVATNQTGMMVETGNAVSDHTLKENLGKALGRLASGVFIITAFDEQQPEGIMATWVSQASFKPPIVTAAFNKERPFLKLLKEGSLLSINVLSAKNMDIFKAFARPASEESRFNGLKLSEHGSAGPVFAKAVAYLDCKVLQLVETGDHVLTVAEVIGGDMLNGEEEPMTHLRKSGFQY